MNPAITEALDKVRQEEARLVAEQTRINAELDRIRQVVVMLEEQSGTRRPQEHKIAPRGLLDEEILRTLNRSAPKSRKQLIEEIGAAGYPYKLTEQHVTRHLITLTRERKVKRVGEGVRSRYVLRSGK